MKKYKTSVSKKDIVNKIVELFNEANVGYGINPVDRYTFGRYMALWDLLNYVKIYEDDEEEEE